LKHQASDPSSTGSASTIFADSNGNLAWLNNGLNKVTFDADAVTAARVYTFKDASGTVAFTSDITGTNSGVNTGDQTITLTGAVTGSGTGTFPTSLGSFTTAQLNTALSDNDIATGGGTATGTNTGDETDTSIKSKLGITTLSGSNTGDQTSIV